MIIFMENISKIQESGRVIPWIQFRRVIYDIYVDRLTNSWEINGSLLTTSMSMDEYVCLYFLKVHKLRRIAENKLFEFLVSLRYYNKSWPRASLFALLCNLTTF